MSAPNVRSGFPLLFGTGLVTGAAIAAVDNFAFEGEISPIVIVALLLAATVTFGMIWRWRGWPAAVTAWAWIPLVHLVKHIAALPDTLQRNTYASILMLAAFTFVVAAIGLGCGVALRKLAS